MVDRLYIRPGHAQDHVAHHVANMNDYVALEAHPWMRTLMGHDVYMPVEFQGVRYACIADAVADAEDAAEAWLVAAREWPAVQRDLLNTRQAYLMRYVGQGRFVRDHAMESARSTLRAAQNQR